MFSCKKGAVDKTHPFYNLINVNKYKHISHINKYFSLLKHRNDTKHCYYTPIKRKIVSINIKVCTLHTDL